MAISLSNHEDRIKALEGIKLEWTRVAGKQILPTSRTLIATINPHKTSILFIHFTNSNTTNISYMSVMSAGGTIHSSTLWPTDGNRSEVIFCEIHNTEIYVWTSGKDLVDNELISIYGLSLKLYYSFSYNIIYRILLRKISRLVKKLHFNLFEISSRRGGVNYGN